MNTKVYCCEICNIKPHNKKEWGEHLKSKKHKESLSKNSQSGYCFICNVKIKDEKSYNKHTTDNAHRIAEVRFFERIKVELSTKKQSEPVGLMFLSDVSNLECYCRLCDSTFDKSYVNWHFSGREHPSCLTQEIDRVLCGESGSAKEPPKTVKGHKTAESRGEKNQAPVDSSAACPNFDQATSGSFTSTKLPMGTGCSFSNSPITTQVTELWTGQKAKDLKVMVYKQNLDGTGSMDIAMKRTDTDGKTPSLLSDYPWTTGYYKLTFDTGEYFRNRQVSNVTFPFVEVYLPVTDVNERYDIQAFVSPHEYSISRKILENTK